MSLLPLAECPHGNLWKIPSMGTPGKYFAAQILFSAPLSGLFGLKRTKPLSGNASPLLAQHKNNNSSCSLWSLDLLGGFSRCFINAVQVSWLLSHSGSIFFLHKGMGFSFLHQNKLCSPQRGARSLQIRSLVNKSGSFPVLRSRGFCSYFLTDINKALNLLYPYGL